MKNTAKEKLSENLAKLTDEMLEQLSGGNDIDCLAPYVLIMKYILDGDAPNAKLWFKVYYSELTDDDKGIIRNKFYKNFGYSIDD